MKKLIVISTFLGLAFIAKSQTIEDGKKLLRYERNEAAKKVFTTLGDVQEAKYNLGVTDLMLGETSTAQQIFENLSDQNLKRAGLARVMFAENKNSEALVLLEEMTKKVKKKEYLPYQLAGEATLSSTNEADYLKGISWLEESLLRNPNSNVYVELGDLYRKTSGGGGKAMSSYENAADLDPNNSLAYSRQGALWYAAKVYDSVLVKYNKAKEVDPNNPQPYGDLADVYNAVGKYELAKQNIEKYLSLSDKNEIDQIKYMNLLFLSKYYGETITQANSLLKSGVEKPYIYRLLGESYLEQGDSINALNSFLSFFKKQPSNKVLTSDYLALGKIYLKLDSLEMANQNFEKSVNLDTASNKNEIYSTIGDLFKDKKRYDIAGTWYDKIIASGKADPTQYFWAGIMKYYDKKYDKAAQIFADFQTKYPEQPSAFYWGGRSLAAQDKEAKTGAAIPAFQKYLGMTSGDSSKNKDRATAMEYLALYNYNSGKKAEAKTLCQNIMAIDSSNALVKQLLPLLK